MTVKEKLIQALGDDYTVSDELAIDRLLVYYDIFKEATKHIKKEGYRRMVTANPVPGLPPQANQRYYMNIAFIAMNETVKHIRAEIEILGLSKKGKKLEITNKIEKNLSLLDQMNELPDE
jgi:hypothetical protein